MQLDKTHIVVRPRTVSEIGDLTLAMLRIYPRSILIGFTVGAMGWALLNLVLIGWIPIREYGLGLTDEEASAELFRYVSWMTVLVVLQTPIAGVFTTLYLGRAVFEQRLTWGAVIRETGGHWRDLFSVFLVRGLVLPVALFLFFRWDYPFSYLVDGFFPLLVLVTLFLIRGTKPFLAEILLLEKCEVRPKSKRDLSLSVRSKYLHRPSSGEHAGRFVILGAVYSVLLFCFFMTAMSVRGVLLLRWDFLDLGVLLVLYPACLWAVAGITVIAKMLFYLDTRIRLEGWDVDLAVRAENLRQFGEGGPRSISKRSVGSERVGSERGVLKAEQKMSAARGSQNRDHTGSSETIPSTAVPDKNEGIS